MNNQILVLDFCPDFLYSQTVLKIISIKVNLRDAVFLWTLQ